MICGLQNCATANDLDRPSRSFRIFFSKNKSNLLFQSLMYSPGELMKDEIADDLQCSLKVISGLLYDAEHDLLLTAKFLVSSSS